MLLLLFVLDHMTTQTREKMDIKLIKPPWHEVPFEVPRVVPQTSPDNAALEAAIDPFASWTWEDQELVRRNNEVMNNFTRDGACSFGSTALANTVFAGFGPILRPIMWGVRFGLCVTERVDLAALVQQRGISRYSYDAIGKDVTRAYGELNAAALERNYLSLYRLLVAMAVYNPSIGYNQGMDKLAIVLIDVFKDSISHQFWAFDYVITQITPHYFTRDMIGVHVDLQLVLYYVNNRLPHLTDAIAKLDKQAEKENCMLRHLCYTMFPVLFVGWMRYELLLRLWDKIIFDGPSALFTFMVQLIEKNRDLILSPDTSDSTVVLLAIKRYLAELRTLDELLMRLPKPIDTNDVALRRAAELNAIVTAHPEDACYQVHMSLGCIPGYANAGRGCLCTPPPPPAGSEFSRNVLICLFFFLFKRKRSASSTRP